MLIGKINIFQLLPNTEDRVIVNYEIKYKVYNDSSIHSQILLLPSMTDNELFELKQKISYSIMDEFSKHFNNNELLNNSMSELISIEEV